MNRCRSSWLVDLSPSQAAKLFHLDGQDLVILQQAAKVIEASAEEINSRLRSRLGILSGGTAMSKSMGLSGDRRGGLKKWISLGLKPWNPLSREPRLKHLVVFCARNNLPATCIAAVCWCLEEICVDLLLAHGKGAGMDPADVDKLIGVFRKRLATEQLGLLAIHSQYTRGRCKAHSDRLRKIIKVRSARLRSTVSLSQALAQEHDESQAAKALAQHVMGIFQPDYLAIHLIDESEVVETPVLMVGGRLVDQTDDDAMQALRADWRLCRVARTGRSFYVADAASSLVRCDRQTRPESQGCYCCIPLASGTQVVGWMHLRRSEVAGFAAEEQEVLSIYGQMVGNAITSIRLVRENRQQATTDPLTGLHNRRHFQTVLAREGMLLRRRGGDASILMVDVDKFKDFNDRFGHEAGDRVLVALAKMLRMSVRTTDEVARLGGDEFVLLLRDCDAVNAGELAAKIVHQAAQTPVHLDAAQCMPLSVSIGSASCPLHACSLEEALLLADLALLKAKESGRSRHVAFDRAAGVAVGAGHALRQR